MRGQCKTTHLPKTGLVLLTDIGNHGAIDHADIVSE